MKDNIIRLHVGWDDVIRTYNRRKRWVLPHLWDRLRIMKLTRLYLEWEAVSEEMVRQLIGTQYLRRGRRGL